MLFAVRVKKWRRGRRKQNWKRRATKQEAQRSNRCRRRCYCRFAIVKKNGFVAFVGARISLLTVPKGLRAPFVWNFVVQFQLETVQWRRNNKICRLYRSARSLCGNFISENAVRGKIQLDSYVSVLVPQFFVCENNVQLACVRHVKFFLLGQFGSQFFFYFAFSWQRIIFILRTVVVLYMLHIFAMHA